MPQTFSMLVLGLVLLASCSCNDRRVGDDEPQPDIEGLCQTFCERTFECGRPAPSVSTVEECVQLCIDVPEWDNPSCVAPREALYLCINDFECPDFTNIVVCDDDTQPDHECCPESNASMMCI